MESISLFSQAHLGDLKKALDIYARRHRVIAANVANVETPEYVAREYRFEEYLQNAPASRLTTTQTRPGHLALGGKTVADAEGKVVKQKQDFDNGINNVDIDQEMGRLGMNDLSYQLATRLLSMKYRLLRGAIKGTIR